MAFMDELQRMTETPANPAVLQHANTAPQGEGNFLSMEEASKLSGIKKPTLVGRINAGKLKGRRVQVGNRELWYVERASLMEQPKPNHRDMSGVRPDLKVRNALRVSMGRMPTKLETYAEMQRLGMKLKPFQLNRLRNGDEGPSRAAEQRDKRKGRQPMITRDFVDNALGRQQNTAALPVGVSAVGDANAVEKLTQLRDLIAAVSSGLAEITAFDITLRFRQ